jgi:hypothetical protein
VAEAEAEAAAEVAAEKAAAEKAAAEKAVAEDAAAEVAAEKAAAEKAAEEQKRKKADGDALRYYRRELLTCGDCARARLRAPDHLCPDHEALVGSYARALLTLDDDEA